MLLKMLPLAYLYNLSECDVERFWSRAHGASDVRLADRPAAPSAGSLGNLPVAALAFLGGGGS